MKNDYYEQALALADDDPDILDDVHEILVADGISESAYAKVFALVFYANRDESERILYSAAEKVWRCGTKIITDVKLFATLDQCCDLIRNYTLSSWEKCVFSAWAPRKEVIKAEKDMDILESLSHVKSILALAAPLMAAEAHDAQPINWQDTHEENESED